MKSSWMAATAALCVFAPASSWGQPSPAWPPPTPYDTPPDEISPSPPPRRPPAKAPATPYDAPPKETVAPGEGAGPEALDPSGAPGGAARPAAPPPKISPPSGAAAPPPAPAPPLTSLPAVPASSLERVMPAAPFGPAGTSDAYGQPLPFQAQLPPAVSFGGAQLPPDSAGETDWRLAGGLISTGLGAGMFVVMGLSLARIDAIQNDPAFETYRSGFTADQSACAQAAAGQRVNISGAATAAAADELCREADTLEVVSYVSIGAGAALLGLGGYLIFSSDTVSGGDAALRIDPQVGPGHGSLQVSFRF